MTSVRKRKMNVLSLEDRISVINESKKGRSQRDLANQFNCGKSQIQNCLANRERFLKEWEENVNKSKKKSRWQPNEEINSAVFEWFNRARAKGLPVTGPMLQEKALKFASDLQVVNFTASNGWLDRFRMRHNIVFRAICGESAQVNEDIVVEWKLRVPQITSGYSDRDIFNMDETGLFFKAIPDKTLTLKGEQCKGGKMAKQRLTLGLCANLCGEKEEPIVIHTSNRPRCFKNTNMSLLGVFWCANKKAWMTCEIFLSWLSKLNEKMRNQNRKILLFVDNAPCHCNETLSNVTIKFFPANTTSCLQPLDQGVIRSFKVNYRKKLMHSLVAKMDSATSVHELAKSVTVADAVSWAKSAWKEVKPETIKKCFINCGFESSDNVNRPTEDCVDNDEDASDLNQLCSAAGIEIVTMSSINEQVTCFNDGETWDEVAAEINSDCKSDEHDSDCDEDGTTDTEPIQLNEALQSIARHQSLARELGNQKLMNLLSEIENEYENVVLNNRMGKVKQMSITHYLRKDNDF